MKLTKNLNIVLPGAIYPVTLEAGWEIAEHVAAEHLTEVEDVALAAGCAELTPAEVKARAKAKAEAQAGAADAPAEGA